jgi:hypothetical protein
MNIERYNIQFQKLSIKEAISSQVYLLILVLIAI